MTNYYIERKKVFQLIAGFLTVAILSISTRSESADQPSASELDDKPPAVQEMIEARTDVWGDVAMRQPNGASYEFFKDLLPPVRWVNAEFRYYPIVLSAPRAVQKARLVSNGSAVNARANRPPVLKSASPTAKVPPPMWKDQGVPVQFFVGEPAETFGGDFARLQEP